MPAGFATPEGTARYAARHGKPDFYRTAQGLTVSSLGLGSYLGPMTDAADAGYRDAVAAALSGGINFLDTSLNYRNQRSERALAAGIRQAMTRGLNRDEFVVCTKAGYLVPDAVPAGVLHPEDIVGGMHCLAPAFLEDQLERSRRNLELETIDVFYLHNPETQLQPLGDDAFYERIRLAFFACEQFAAAGRIRFYGTATWNGYRQKGGLSLRWLASLAREAGGDHHHFRFIQLPFNLAMTEALRNGVLEQAREFGISVVTSASILQSRLVQGLPEELHPRFPGAATDAQRAIQFARSAPGVGVALVGMSRIEHVEENLGVSAFPPLSEHEFAALFQ
jgi:aryl-alcohol dehydrogenase-like predicted oxidoreductase